MKGESKKVMQALDVWLEALKCELKVHGPGGVDDVRG